MAHGWAAENGTRHDVHDAWRVEDLADGRVRILTQETQQGSPARIWRREGARESDDQRSSGLAGWADRRGKQGEERRAVIDREPVFTRDAVNLRISPRQVMLRCTNDKSPFKKQNERLTSRCCTAAST